MEVQCEKDEFLLPPEVERKREEGKCGEKYRKSIANGKTLLQYAVLDQSLFGAKRNKRKMDDSW